MSFFLIASFYLVSKRLAYTFIKSPVFSQITGLAVCLLPWIMMRSFAPIPETVGLLFFEITVLFFVKSNPIKFTSILVSLSLFHGRSFFSVIGLVVIFLCADAFSKKKPNTKFILGIIFSILVTSFWWVPIFGNILEVSSLKNLWISEYNPIMLFGAAAIFSLFGLFIFSQTNLDRKKLKYIGIWLIAAYAMYIIGTITGKNVLKFRELVYGFFPIAFFSVLFLTNIKKSKIKKSEHNTKNQNNMQLEIKKYSTAVFLILMLISSAWVINSRYPPIDVFDYSAMNTMADFKGTMVLTGFTSGYGIPIISEKKVIIGPFMEQLSDAQERLSDVDDFFKYSTDSNKIKILEKYNADLVYISRFEILEFGKTNVQILNNENKLDKIFENPYSKIYSVNKIKQKFSQNK